MSLVSALMKLRETLTFPGLPDLILAIPEVFQNAPLPLLFVDVTMVHAVYGALRAEFQTEATANLKLVFAVAQQNIPTNKEWFLWPIEIAEGLIKKMEQDTADRVYENDGDKGFEVKILNWTVEYDSKTGPIATGILNLQLGGFL